MKFKAKFSQDDVKNFIGVLQSVEKVASLCALQLTSDAILIKTRPDGDTEMQVSAQYNTAHFMEYKKHRDGPVEDIALEVLVGNLIRGLKSAGQADSCTMKLTKKNGQPCLSVIADTLTSIVVVQDIPICKMLTVEELHSFRDPMLPQPNIVLQFPDPRNVRTVLDRMKLLDKFVRVTAHEQGLLVLKVETEVVSVETAFQGLQVHEMQKEESQTKRARIAESNGILAHRKGATFSALLNIKELHRALHLGQVQFDQIVLCFIIGRALVIHVVFSDDCGTQTFFLPLNESIEDDEYDVA